jgi:hypothetical protein
MNRPYTRIARWISRSYQHVGISCALSAKNPKTAKSEFLGSRIWKIDRMNTGDYSGFIAWILDFCPDYRRRSKAGAPENSLPDQAPGYRPDYDRCGSLLGKA